MKGILLISEEKIRELTVGKLILFHGRYYIVNSEWNHGSILRDTEWCANCKTNVTIPHICPNRYKVMNSEGNYGTILKDTEWCRKCARNVTIPHICPNRA